MAFPFLLEVQRKGARAQDLNLSSQDSAPARCRVRGPVRKMCACVWTNSPYLTRAMKCEVREGLLVKSVVSERSRKEAGRGGILHHGVSGVHAPH